MNAADFCPRCGREHNPYYACGTNVVPPTLGAPLLDAYLAGLAPVRPA